MPGSLIPLAVAQPLLEPLQAARMEAARDPPHRNHVNYLPQKDVVTCACAK